jgi:hypothetical protein
VGGGVKLDPLGTAATNRPIVPAPGDYDDGEIGGMMIGRGNWSTHRKPAPVLLCPPQTSHACPDANPGCCGGKPATNCLRYFKWEASRGLCAHTVYCCSLCLLAWSLTQRLSTTYTKYQNSVHSCASCVQLKSAHFIFARCKPACQIFWGGDQPDLVWVFVTPDKVWTAALNFHHWK